MPYLSQRTVSVMSELASATYHLGGRCEFS